MKDQSPLKLSTVLSSFIIFTAFPIGLLFIPVKLSTVLGNYQHLNMQEIGFSSISIFLNLLVALAITVLIPVISYTLISSSQKPQLTAGIFISTILLVNVFFYRLNIFENNISVISAGYYFFFNSLASSGILVKCYELLKQKTLSQKGLASSLVA